MTVFLFLIKQVSHWRCIFSASHQICTFTAALWAAVADGGQAWGEPVDSAHYVAAGGGGEEGALSTVVL